MEYPEHEKLCAIKDQSQALGEFIAEWMPTQGLHLAKFDSTGKLELSLLPITSILEKFFGIDNNKLQLEKAAMIARLVKEMGEDAGAQ